MITVHFQYECPSTWPSRSFSVLLVIEPRRPLVVRLNSSPWSEEWATTSVVPSTSQCLAIQVVPGSPGSLGPGEPEAAFI